MKSDARFRNYYLSVYGAFRIQHRRIFDEPSAVVVQSDEHWSSKVEIALDEERRALERCQEEIISRQARVSWLEQVQADNFGDRYLWRQGLIPLPSWKSKAARHAAKRKAAKLYPNPSESKKSKSDIPLGGKPVSDHRTVTMRTMRILPDK